MRNIFTNPITNPWTYMIKDLNDKKILEKSFMRKIYC